MSSQSNIANSQHFHAFNTKIKALLAPEHIISDSARLIAFATDASFYTKIPKLILKVPSVKLMKQIVSLANIYKIPLTFRAAGTSLSGQAITDSVLVMLTSDWTQYQIFEDGAAISLAPGIIGAKANKILAQYNRKIGPDPASINACKIGGIAANNASGMCCGVKNNSYHTLRDIHIILADGSEVDTSSANSVEQFRSSHNSLLSALTALRRRLLENNDLVEKIRYQFRIKNTMGYGLNALLDFDDPLDILTHLMIGSEGTLGFIANITYNTVPLPLARQSALYLFNNFELACGVIPALKACNVDAVELMDTRALNAVAPLLSEITTANFDSGDVALLIDVGSQSQMNDTITTLRSILQQQGNGRALCDFTSDSSTIEKLWNIRKGLFPAVGAVRPGGTTVIIEDVAFPLEKLASGLNALVTLFEKFGYHDSIIFGHALDGNVHFVFSQGFNSESEIARYDQFMQAIGTMVTRQFNGSLKAEHGTGRNMAPFLVAQWGHDGVEIMRELKQIIDPNGILNPGVILNDNPNAHLTDLKPMPAINDTIDACIECGFCEPQCPSLHYTLSPRQRIALRRRQQSLMQQGDIDTCTQIDATFNHLAIDSCAATGMCATACPVGINTGTWIKQLRSEHSKHKFVASLLATHTNNALSIARFAINSGHMAKQLLGEKKLARVTDALHLPRFHQAMPPAASPLSFSATDKSKIPSAATHTNSKLVYMLSCPTRVFGPNKDETSINQAVLSLCKKAGIEVILSTNNHCCGQPWASEGYNDIAARKNAQWLAHANMLSENGRWPVVTDNSACAYMSTSTASAEPSSAKPIEVSEYLLNYVAPKLTIKKMTSPLLLHVGCSSTHIDNGNALIQLAKLCAHTVHIPQDITCCGFAGTKGFTHPKLNEHALAPLKQQVPEGCTRGVSSSNTCAIGLTQHSGIHYSHIAVLLDEISQGRF